MTATTNAGFDSASAAGAVGLLYLVELDFLAGTQYYTNWPHDFPADVGAGLHTYTGLGNLGSVGEMRESEDGAVQTVDLTLSQVNASLLSLALGNIANYVDRPARIYLALTDENFVVSGSPVLRFVGYMEPTRVDVAKGTITLPCSTGGYDVRSNPAALRLNDAQHQARYPGELLFQYTGDLIGKPSRWLSTRFQASLAP